MEKVKRTKDVVVVCDFDEGLVIYHAEKDIMYLLRLRLE